jgi:hypothetical protein
MKENSTIQAQRTAATRRANYNRHAPCRSLQSMVKALSVSFFGKTIPKGNGFEFDADSVLDWYYRASLKYKCR